MKFFQRWSVLQKVTALIVGSLFSSVVYMAGAFSSAIEIFNWANKYYRSSPSACLFDDCPIFRGEEPVSSENLELVNSKSKEFLDIFIKLRNSQNKKEQEVALKGIDLVIDFEDSASVEVKSFLYTARGLFFRKQGRLKEAKEDLEKAYLLNPENGYAASSLLKIRKEEESRKSGIRKSSFDLQSVGKGLADEKILSGSFSRTVLIEDSPIPSVKPPPVPATIIQGLTPQAENALSERAHWSLARFYTSASLASFPTHAFPTEEKSFSGMNLTFNYDSVGRIAGLSYPNRYETSYRNLDSTGNRMLDWSDTNEKGWGKPGIADVNGDGRMDLVWDELGEDNGFHFALGQADGTFTSLSSQGHTSKWWDGFMTYTVDINGDGRTDLANVLTSTYLSRGPATNGTVVEEKRQVSSSSSGTTTAAQRIWLKSALNQVLVMGGNRKRGWDRQTEAISYRIDRALDVSLFKSFNGAAISSGKSLNFTPSKAFDDGMGQHVLKNTASLQPWKMAIAADPAISSSSRSTRAVSVALHPTEEQSVIKRVRYHNTRGIKESRKIALTVGIDSLEGGPVSQGQPLQFAVSDATRIAGDLEGLGFVTKTLTNEAAEKTSILNHLLQESWNSGPDDILVLYIAAHGFSDPDGNGFVIVRGGGASPEGRLSIDEINATLSLFEGKAYVIIDSCSLPYGRRSVESLLFGTGPMRSDNVTYLLASSPGEKAIESPKLKSGLVTHFLSQYLRQQKIYGEEQTLDFAKMFADAARETQKLARSSYGLSQKPTVIYSNRDPS